MEQCDVCSTVFQWVKCSCWSASFYCGHLCSPKDLCDKRLSHIQPFCVCVCDDKTLLTHITTQASEPFLNLLKQSLLTVTQTTMAFVNIFSIWTKFTVYKWYCCLRGASNVIVVHFNLLISFIYSSQHKALLGEFCIHNECYKVLFHCYEMPTIWNFWYSCDCTAIGYPTPFFWQQLNVIFSPQNATNWGKMAFEVPSTTLKAQHSPHPSYLMVMGNWTKMKWRRKIR